MRSYTVHQPPLTAATSERETASRIVLIGEGFDWFAFVLPVVWAIWHRLWWPLAAIVVGVAIVEGALLAAGASAEGWLADVIGSALLVVIGFEANDIRRWALRRRAWRDIGLVVAHDRAEAERKVFENWRHAAMAG